MANPIYCALDVPTASDALALAKKIAPYVGGVKIGMELFYAAGPDIVRAVQAETGLPIFIDLKLYDIPNTVRGGLASLLKLAPAILNVHASGGADMLKAAHDIVREISPQTKIIGVTVLTSFDEPAWAQTGMQHDTQKSALHFAELVRASGCDGIVCSAHELAPVRAAWPDIFTVVPGIRPVGSAAGDQKRVMSPAQALHAGASVLVIGRPITAAENPAAAAADIFASLH